MVFYDGKKKSFETKPESFRLRHWAVRWGQTVCWGQVLKNDNCSKGAKLSLVNLLLGSR